MEIKKITVTSFTKDSLNDFIARFELLFDEGNAAAVASFYHNDAILMADKMPLFRGRNEIKEFWKQIFRRTKFLAVKRTIEIDEIVTYPEISYMTGVTMLSFRLWLFHVKRSYKYLTVWRKCTDRWLISVDISNRNYTKLT